MVVDLVRPRSVIDVGCGTGCWLAAFRTSGVEHVVGLDGDWVKRQDLLIPLASLISVDLQRPLPINGRFDMAASLEVPEHLPPGRAASFVVDLVRLAPVVLFLAAIPHQDGTGHVNEQWPTYWKRLFGKNGYIWLDPFRHRVWADPRVDIWYRRKTFLYVTKDLISSHPAYRREYRSRRRRAAHDLARRCYRVARRLILRFGQ